MRRVILRDLTPFFWLVLAMTLSSCGYTATRILPSYYRTIYVEPFQNGIPITRETDERGFITSFPELEEKVTQGVIGRFISDGNLRITNQLEMADLVLMGKLLDFYRQPIRRKDDDTVEEYRLNLSASVVLRDKEFHEGVAGIVAARLVDELNRPVVTWSGRPVAHL